MSRWSLAALLSLALACGHGEPFTADPPRASGPFTPSVPIRLTYNIGADEWASWAADGRTIFYSVQDSFRMNPAGTFPEPDQCIARIPAEGGTARPIACPPMPMPNDTTTILDQPAPEGAKLAFASSELGVVEHAPFRIALWLADTTPLSTPRRMLTFPYDAPSGKPHDAPLYLRWLRPGVLLYLGAENGCCRKDTLRFGEQVVLLDMGVSPPTRIFVPGTTRAGAVSASPDGATIYYTFYGDSIVWAQQLASGAVSVLHNFGSGHIVRDPTVAGQTLVAVVDGQPRYEDVPAFGMVNMDYGGLLVVVDLATGAETRLLDYGLFYKRPVFSPDGARFVAEGFQLSFVTRQVSPGTFVTDTLVSKWADLYLFEE